MTFYSFTSGLTTIGRTEHLSEWLPIEPGRKLLVYSAADIIISVYVEFSHEPTEPVNDYRLAYQKISILNRQFKSDSVRALSRFIRFRFQNGSGAQNEHLEFYVYTYETPTKSAITPAPENAPRECVSGELTPRGGNGTPLKERRRSLFGKKEEGKTELKSQLDYRLPQFIHKDNLLVGANNGRVSILPKGLVGQVLTVTEEGLEYKFPFPPRG